MRESFLLRETSPMGSDASGSECSPGAREMRVKTPGSACSTDSSMGFNSSDEDLGSVCSAEDSDWEDEPRAEIPESGLPMDGEDVGCPPLRGLSLPQSQVSYTVVPVYGRSVFESDWEIPRVNSVTRKECRIAEVKRSPSASRNQEVERHVDKTREDYIQRVLAEAKNQKAHNISLHNKNLEMEKLEKEKIKAVNAAEKKEKNKQSPQELSLSKPVLRLTQNSVEKKKKKKKSSPPNGARGKRRSPSENKENSPPNAVC